MSVLKEILKWSQARDRPAWQRDALRRLVSKGELSEDDIRELGEICKSPYGLTEQQDTIPLTRVHIPDNATGSAPVSTTIDFSPPRRKRSCGRTDPKVCFASNPGLW